MIPRKSNGEADVTANVDKWTVTTEICPVWRDDWGGEVPMERRWWALDPRFDIENLRYDSDFHAKDRSEIFDDFENALAYALTMARGDAL